MLCLQLIYSVKDSGELVAPPSSSDPADTVEYNLVYRAAEDRCQHVYCRYTLKISIDILFATLMPGNGLSQSPFLPGFSCNTNAL